MSCKIQMPQKAQQSLRLAGKHGKFRVQTICNEVPEDEIKFDATSGDIKLKLNCKEPEEYDDDWFIVDEKDLLVEIEKLKAKMEELEMEVETLKEKHELDIDTINKELEELNDMLNSY